MTDLYDITKTFTKNQENLWNICKKYVDYNILYIFINVKHFNIILIIIILLKCIWPMFDIIS